MSSTKTQPSVIQPSAPSIVITSEGARMIRPVMIALAVACLFASFTFAAPTTVPAEVTPAAKKLLSTTADAYRNLKTLTLSGTITGDFDVDGQKQNHSARFSPTYAAPNKFRDQMEGDDLLGSTGQQMYVFSKSRNAYLMIDAPKSKVVSSELPDPFAQLLSSQN